MKKYLAHTTCIKCISVLKYFANPSIIGNKDQATRFKMIAFIDMFFLEMFIYQTKTNILYNYFIYY